MNIFEQATKTKTRFSTSVGNLTVEDLWDLPITSKRGPNLSDIARSLQSELSSQPTSELDFLDATITVDATMQLRFDIVKSIIISKQADITAKTDAKAIESHNAKIDELITKKQDEDLAGMSIEDLTKLKK